MTGTERKVFQKYYPPDFDPSKIPKAERGRNRQFIQRVMAPFNMQCNTCSEYIYKGRKFNMKRETAEGEVYLGMKIFRFYFRCPNCLAEITFKTDIENVDYAMEHGATRLFDAFKFYQEKEKERANEEEEEKADAMKMLEKRTKMSKIEMEALGQIEELQEMNRRNEKVDTLGYLDVEEKKRELTVAEQHKLQEEEDERELQRLLGRIEEKGKLVRRLNDEEESEARKLENEPTPSTSSIGSRDRLPPSTSREADRRENTSSTGEGSSFASKLNTLKRKVAAKPSFMQGVIVKKKDKSAVPD